MQHDKAGKILPMQTIEGEKEMLQYSSETPEAFCSKNSENIRLKREILSSCNSPDLPFSSFHEADSRHRELQLFFW